MKRALALSLSAALTMIMAVVAMSPVAQAADLGQFSTKCFFSHANSDDPIVYPGQEGFAHRHHFLGAESVNYLTTTESLQAGTTNCDRPQDLAAYWIPALYFNGVERFPDELHAYYRNTNVSGDAKDDIVPFPLGLRMIAGTAFHPDPPSGYRTNEWSCASGGNVGPGTPSVPASCNGKRLIALITFPSCWDGVNLTTADQSHMLYPWQNPSGQRVCPSTHPVTLPELTEHIRYNNPPLNLAGTTLSSGATNTLHADFWNAWEEPTLDFLVDGCILAKIKCGTVGGFPDPPGAP